MNFIQKQNNISVLNNLSDNLLDSFLKFPAVFASGNPKEDLNPKKKKNPTKTLDQYSRDLTKLAREEKLDPVIGRESEILRVIQILSRRTKNNPCLIGEPGAGKTAIAEGLALKPQKIHSPSGKFPPGTPDRPHKKSWEERVSHTFWHPLRKFRCCCRLAFKQCRCYNVSQLNFTAIFEKRQGESNK